MLIFRKANFSIKLGKNELFYHQKSSFFAKTARRIFLKLKELKEHLKDSTDSRGNKIFGKIETTTVKWKLKNLAVMFSGSLYPDQQKQNTKSLLQIINTSAIQAIIVNSASIAERLWTLFSAVPPDMNCFATGASLKWPNL